MKNFQVSPSTEKAQLEHMRFPKKTFLQQMYDFLETRSFDDLIDWSSDGSSIVIKDLDNFTDKVLSMLFNHKNFFSFVRQLHMYNFKKNKNPGYACSYSNPCFKKSNRNLLDKIKRRTVCRPVLESKPQPLSERNKLDQLELENEVLKNNEKCLKIDLDQAFDTIYQLQMRNQELKDQLKPIENQEIFNKSLPGQVSGLYIEASQEGNNALHGSKKPYDHDSLKKNPLHQQISRSEWNFNGLPDGAISNQRPHIPKQSQNYWLEAKNLEDQDLFADLISTKSLESLNFQFNQNSNDFAWKLNLPTNDQFDDQRMNILSSSRCSTIYESPKKLPQQSDQSLPADFTANNNYLLGVICPISLNEFE